jgi:hypothetical protein
LIVWILVLGDLHKFPFLEGLGIGFKTRVSEIEADCAVIAVLEI